MKAEYAALAETLVNKIIELMPRAHMTMNGCGEDGRIDVQFHSVRKLSTVVTSPRKMEQFKRGEIGLYLNDISFFIECSTDDETWTPFKLPKKLGAGK